VLSAVAYRASQKVAASEIRTAGVPARLQITPLTISIASDLSFYEITVVDAAGLAVTDATPAVKVDVAGAGRLVGLDTGDLNYGGRFKVDTRDAFQGRLLVTIQSTAPSGEIHLTVSAPKLPAATLTASANSSSGK
jgi:beta-galactosidase